MKKLYPTLFMLCSMHTWAQVSDAYKTQIESIFQKVNRSYVATGLLSDYGLHFTNISKFNSIPSDTTILILASPTFAIFANNNLLDCEECNLCDPNPPYFGHMKIIGQAFLIKNMKKPKTLFLGCGLILIASLFNSCSLDFDLDIPAPCLFCYVVTPIKKGLNTTVSGKAYDYIWEQSIVGVKVYLEHSEDVGYRKSIYIDSALTDSNGNYSFNFTTDGVAYSYSIIFQPTPLGHYEAYSYHYEINNFGKREIIDFDAAKLNVAKIHLQVIDNPNPPLRVYTRFGGGTFVKKRDMDTTTWVLVMPNRINQIYFNITNPDTTSLYNFRVDTINLIGNFKDTVYREYIVQPKEFKERG